MASPGTELASLDFGNLIGGPLVAVINAQSIAADATTKFIKEVGFYPANQPDAPDGTKLAGTPVYVDFKYPKEVQPYQPGVGVPGDTLLPPYKAEVPSMAAIFTTSTPTIVTAGTAVTFDAAWIGRPIDTTPDQTALRTIISVDTAASPNTLTLSAAHTGSPTAFSLPLVGDVNFPNGRPAYAAPVQAVYQEMKISVAMLTIVPIPFIKVERCTIDFNAKINSMETTASSSDFSANASLSASYGGKRANVSFTGSAAYKKTSSSGSSVERTFSMAISVSAVQDDMPPGMEKLLNILEGAMKSTPGAILPPASDVTTA
jgi:hypothetical protein